MKVKIHEVSIPIRAELSLTGKEEDVKCYTVEYKRHWWQRYKFIYDPRTHVPYLFSSIQEVWSHIYSHGMRWNTNANR